MSDFIQVFAGRPQSSRVLYVGMTLQEAQALDVAVYIDMEIGQKFVYITWRLPLWVYIFQAEVLRARGFLEVPKKQLYFSLQENRQDALARIRGALLKEGIFVDCVALELEFTSVGVCTLWPGELKYENGRYRLFGTLYGHLMDCHGRILYRLFI